MKIAFGLYTAMPASTPSLIMQRVIKDVYGPVLSFMYNNPNIKLSFYQSSDVMKYIENREAKEYEILITSLARRGDLEILTGSYSSSPLSLLSPKDRGRDIEMMTTFIRRRYGVRAQSLFLSTGVWAPYYIPSLLNAGLSSIVISQYRDNIGGAEKKRSYVMSENGKKFKIYALSDEISSLVHSYSNGSATLKDIEEGLFRLSKEKDRESVVFLNIDQMLLGCEKNKGDDISSFLVSIFEKYGEKFTSLSLLSTKSAGYLDSGWYGRDAKKGSLTSFGDLFTKNETFRYMLSRYQSLSSSTVSFKKSPAIKRAMETSLLSIPLGPLFQADSLCSPMRSEVRRRFWNGILRAEWEALDVEGVTLPYEEYLESYSSTDYIARNKNLIGVFSPTGGSVAEFSVRSLYENIFDYKTFFKDDLSCSEMKRSFTDTLRINRRRVDLSREEYDMDIAHKVRGDCNFICQKPNFTLQKSFHLRSQTLGMDAVLCFDEDVEGEYIVSVYLSSSTFCLVSPEQRKMLAVGKLDDVKTVRYAIKKDDFQISFSSTEPFSVQEERHSQKADTALGAEVFDLSMRITFTFPLNVKAGECKLIKLMARASI